MKEQWRAWRATTIRPEPPASDKQVTRVALMMPQKTGAGRVVRRFPQDAPVEELYAFVECYENINTEADGAASEPVDYEHKYTFKIVSTLPKEVYEPSQTATIGETIGRSGNLIVEEIVEDEVEEGDIEEE
jgi:FAS-associated factor 2